MLLYLLYSERRILSFHSQDIPTSYIQNLHTVLLLPYHLYINKQIMSGGKIILDKALRSAVNLSSSKLPSEVAKSSAKLFSALSGTKFVLPDLAYDYNALEPAISAETMEIHHSKHHQVRSAYGFKLALIVSPT